MHIQPAWVRSSHTGNYHCTMYVQSCTGSYYHQHWPDPKQHGTTESAVCDPLSTVQKHNPHIQSSWCLRSNVISHHLIRPTLLHSTNAPLHSVYLMGHVALVTQIWRLLEIWGTPGGYASHGAAAHAAPAAATGLLYKPLALRHTTCSTLSHAPVTVSSPSWT